MEFPADLSKLSWTELEQLEDAVNKSIGTLPSLRPIKRERQSAIQAEFERRLFH